MNRNRSTTPPLRKNPLTGANRVRFAHDLRRKYLANPALTIEQLALTAGYDAPLVERLLREVGTNIRRRPAVSQQLPRRVAGTLRQLAKIAGRGNFSEGTPDRLSLSEGIRYVHDRDIPIELIADRLSLHPNRVVRLLNETPAGTWYGHWERCETGNRYRQKGVIERWRPESTFGFLVASDGKPWFVSQLSLPCGIDFLPPGTVVSFFGTPIPRSTKSSPEAKGVKILN